MTKRSRKIGIKFKIIGGLILLLLLLLSLNNLINYRLNSNRIREAVMKRELPLTIDKLSMSLSEYIEQYLTVSAFMAKSHFVHEWLKAGEKDSLAMKAFLSKVKKDFGVESATLSSNQSLHYYYPQGILTTLSDTSKFDAWYFKFRESGKEKGLNLAFSRHLSKLTLFVNYRMEDEQGQFLGCTGVAISLAEMVEEITNYKFETGAQIYFVNGKGEIKIHQNEKMVQVPTEATDPQKNIQSKEGIREAANEILSQQSHRFSYRNDKGEMLGVSRYFEDLDLYLIVEVPTAAVLDELNQMFWVDLLIILATVSLSTILVVLMVNQVVLKPLDKLRSNLFYFFDFLNRKTYKVNLKAINTQDEIGSMARAINRNIREIQKGTIQDMKLIKETTLIADEISRGIIQQKITQEGNNPELINLRNEINEMLDTLQHSVGTDINRIIEVMSKYGVMDFTEQIQAPEGQIEKQVNQMGKQIQEQYEQIQAQNDAIKAQNTVLTTTQAEIRQQNEELKVLYQSINSSIKAAQTIQQAILPYPSKLNRLLKDYFVIYRPKDVVSGDFFWLNKVENTTVLAVVDCTGHGVPGAFMSLIGNTLLDKIIRVWGILDPAEILTKLHEEVKTVLRQEETENNNGMDMSLITWQDGQHSDYIDLQFAGAKNGLYYYEPTNKQLQHCKGARKSIGGQQNELKYFVTETFCLEKGSMLYMGSDGYEDQNNPKRHKFGSRQLAKLLENIAPQPLEQQQAALIKALEQHQQNCPQRDDILLLGFRIA